jgi:hypothetical protein
MGMKIAESRIAMIQKMAGENKSIEIRDPVDGDGNAAGNSGGVENTDGLMCTIEVEQDFLMNLPITCLKCNQWHKKRFFNYSFISTDYPIYLHFT